MGLVLASTSPYRADLLRRLGVDFATVAPEFEESSRDELFADTSDEDFALNLAVAKAHSICGRFAEGWILAADQIAVVSTPKRRLLHKPGSEAAAVEQLMSLAGREHGLVTAVVLMQVESGRYDSRTDRVVLKMRDFGRKEASEYVRDYRPTDCVGSYRIEDAGIRLMESVSGADPTSIMGLPLMSVCELLRAQGLIPA